MSRSGGARPGRRPEPGVFDVAAELGAEIVANMADGLAVHDSGGRLVGWNPAATEITGWTPEVAATHFHAHLPDGLVDLGEGGWVEIRHFGFRHEGQDYSAALFSDARDQAALRDASRRLDRLAVELATTDPLTRAPNRMHGLDRLKQALASGGGAAVLWVGIDRFEHINGTLGSQAGDRVLQLVAARLIEFASDDCTVARVGDDQFALIVPRSLERGRAREMAGRVIDTLSRSLPVGGRELFLSASIGVAVAPQDGSDAGQLFQHADAAMHAAKREGGGRHVAFDPAFADQSAERLSLEHSLRRALDRDELLLVYQPKVDGRDGRTRGFEALVRWQHPELGLLAPGRFLPLAEETGLIDDIDRWTIGTACDQIAAWRHEGRRPLPVAVNVSAHSFQRGDLASVVSRSLARRRLSADMLEIEVTESAVMADPANAEHILWALREQGIRLSIDDFGTGYSSLNYLRRFPVHALKIDRAFVVDLTAGSDEAIAADEAIIAAVVALARGLRLEVIAEGVELPAQREALLRLGCYLMQGYLYGAPVPAEEAGRLVSTARERRDVSAGDLVGPPHRQQ